MVTRRWILALSWSGCFCAFAGKPLVRLSWVNEPTHDRSPLAWLTFGRFLTSDLSSSFRAFLDKPLNGLSSNLAGQAIMSPTMVWLALGHAPFNFSSGLHTDINRSGRLASIDAFFTMKSLPTLIVILLLFTVIGYAYHRQIVKEGNAGC